MRTTTLLFFLVAFSITSFSQKPAMMKSDYQLKSKKQKETAWALLGIGTGLIVLGDLLGNSKKSSFDDAATGVVVAGAGVILVIWSVPLFIASGRNKRKAMSLAFENEMVPMPENGSFSKSFCPSLGIKIGL